MKISVEDINVTTAWHILSEKLGEWVADFIRIIPNLFVALLVVIAFTYLARIARNFSMHVLEKLSKNRTINELTAVSIQLVFISVGVFIALGVLNLEKTVTSLLTGAGIVTLALGFAFQDIASNFFAGILIALRKPYQVGDLVEVNGNIGEVIKIELRMTLIVSLDGIHILIPNKDMFTQVIKNYTITPDRRVSIFVGVAYGSDLDLVEKLTRQALETTPNRIETKPIEFYYKEFADSSINFEAQVWIHYNVGIKINDVYHHAIRNIWKAFTAHQVQIPFPITTLDLPPGAFKN